MRSMVRALVPMGLAMALAVQGCSDGTKESPASSAAVDSSAMASDAPSENVAVSAPCADDGPRLSGTGLCASRSVNYLLFDDGERPKAPDGCEWVVNEVEFPGGDYLLYRGLQCGKNRTELEYGGGAHFADLTLKKSAFGKEAAGGQTLVRMTFAEGKPEDAVTTIARGAIEKPAEAAKCRARKAGIESWPADALVVDVSAEEAAKAAKDEIRSACGTFGLDEDSQRFWRVVQGYAWFFDLGQDTPEIDPGSLTMFSQNAKGEYEVYQQPASGSQ